MVCLLWYSYLMVWLPYSMVCWVAQVGWQWHAGGVTTHFSWPSLSICLHRMKYPGMHLHEPPSLSLSLNSPSAHYQFTMQRQQQKLAIASWRSLLLLILLGEHYHGCIVGLDSWECAVSIITYKCQKSSTHIYSLYCKIITYQNWKSGQKKGA